jgi:hypothetical protein
MLLKLSHGVVSSIFGTSQSLVGLCQDCTAGGGALAIHIFPKFPILHLRHEAERYRYLTPVSFFFHFKAPFYRTGTT